MMSKLKSIIFFVLFIPFYCSAQQKSKDIIRGRLSLIIPTFEIEARLLPHFGLLTRTGMEISNNTNSDFPLLLHLTQHGRFFPLVNIENEFLQGIYLNGQYRVMLGKDGYQTAFGVGIQKYNLFIDLLFLDIGLNYNFLSKDNRDDFDKSEHFLPYFSLGFKIF